MYIVHCACSVPPPHDVHVKSLYVGVAIGRGESIIITYDYFLSLHVYLCVAIMSFVSYHS